MDAAPAAPAKPTRRLKGRSVAGAVALMAALLGPLGGVAGASAGASGASARLGAFKANSMSWLSPRRGWVLGTEPCGAGLCTTVIATRDGGETWSTLGVIPDPIATPGSPGITEIRFSTPRVGWAFGPDLFRSTDGGATWSRQPNPAGAGQVMALAAAPQATYAVVSPCHGTPYCHKPLTLWRANALGTRWTGVPVRLPATFAASVAVYGPAVYVVDQQADLTGQKDVFLASTDDGHSFSTRPVPCDRQPAVALLQVVPTSPTNVDLLCDGNPGFSKALKYVFRSTDSGRTDMYAGRMGLYGIQAQLAVSPSGKLAVASASDGSFMYINNTGGTHWAMVLGLGDGGVGWNDIVYVSNTVAWVVYGPADFTNVGKLVVTRDSGRHWQPITLRSAVAKY